MRTRLRSNTVALTPVTLLLLSLILLIVTGLLIGASCGQMPMEGSLLLASVNSSPVSGRSADLLDIVDVVDTNIESACAKSKLLLVSDQRVISQSHLSDREIPNTIHVTTRSRCLPQAFADTIQQWKNKFSSYSVLVHNDEAVYRLLEQSLAEFPHLSLALQCRHSSMASLTDVWRAVLLYKYGGIYTDLDNTPTDLLVQAMTNLKTSDTAVFVVEEMGYLSQYFVAAPPRHSLVFIWVHTLLNRLLTTTDIDHQYVPATTGPGSLKQAWIDWKGLHNVTNAQTKVKEGDYTSDYFDGRVKVLGKRSDSDAFVSRNVVPNKRKVYQSEMNMVHFSHVKTSNAIESCLQRLWKHVR